MRYRYCPLCGAKLVLKQMGDDGETPWCEVCQKPWFDAFSTCIIALVVNEKEEAALLRQNYISQKYHNLVSGYIKPGENAEICATREIQEELGVKVTRLTNVGSWWFAQKEMLMLGFFAQTHSGELHLSQEVDGAEWVPVERALKMVHPAGSVSYAMVEKYLSMRSVIQSAWF